MRVYTVIWRAAALIALGLAAVAAILIGRLGPDDIRPILVAAVENATGRTLTLGSEMRLTRSLWPTIEVNDVALSNIPGGTRPQMATAERIVLTLSLPALLHRRIELTSVTLTGPNILFEEVAGVPNWRFELPPPAGATPAPPTRPFELRILGAGVRNGMVTWRLPNRTKVVGIRSADVRHDRPDGSIQMGSTLVYSDNAPFALQVDVKPTGPLTAPWTTRLDLTAFDTVARASGTMDTAGHYDLQVDATSGHLDQLNALLPAMQLPAVQGVSVSTRIRNARQNGDVPVVGATRLTFAAAHHPSAPGFELGPTTVTVDKPGGIATLAGTGRYRNQAFAIEGTADIPLYVDGPVSLPVDLKLRSPQQGSAARFDAGVAGKVALETFAFRRFEGSATLATPALAALRPLAPALPALTGVQIAGQIGLSSTSAALDVAGLKLRSEQGDLAGSARIEPGAVPRLTARLRSARLDLEATLAAFGLGGGDWPHGRTVIPDAAIDWSALRGHTLDVAAKVDALDWRNETWRDVDAAVQLEGGHLRKADVTLQIDGAAAFVGMTANAGSGAVPVQLNVDAPKVPLALVARLFGLPGRVDGTAQLHARLSGAGGSLHQLAATLDGTALVAVVGGRLGNPAFALLVGPAVQALGLDVPAEGSTALRCLGLQASFARGIGRITTIALETTYLSLAGTGEVDLGRETLSVMLHPLARVSGSLVRVPVTVQGPFRALSGKLEADGIDKLGIFVDALLGGDDATACKDAGLLPR